LSHLPQRIERDCLNCGTYVVGRYCHGCGQENIEPKESLWHLGVHLFGDITHFDGKFFASLKDLILKPGFLSKEYMLGKRASYLNPIRMYLFTSFVFFLVFFSIFKVDENSFMGINKNDIDQMDSVKIKELSRELNNGNPLTKDELKKKITSASISFGPTKYKSKEEYDSLLKAGAEKHNWFIRKLTYKNIEINEKYHDNKGMAAVNLIDKLQHSIPQMLFVLLPLFALFLKGLYIKRKNYYYTDHAIFTVHFYIFVFIEMLLIFGINKISAVTGALWLQYINLTLVLVLLFYLYKAMRNFYGQNRFKTILKYFLLLFSFLFIGFFLFIIFFLISVFEI
jgi:hypothetical protein